MTTATTTLLDPALYNLVLQLQATRSAKSSLEKKEEELKASIKAKLEDMDDGDMPVNVGDPTTELLPIYKIDLTPTTRRTVNTEMMEKKLLEKGVSPEVIGEATIAATSISTYTTLRVKEVKEGD